MERFAKITNDCQELTTFANRSILDVWQGSEYTSRLTFPEADVPVYSETQLLWSITNF